MTSDVARQEGAAYARMDDEERCAYAGALLRRTWYARTMLGESVADRLVDQGYAVARSQQVPAWVAGDDGVSTHIFCGGRGAGKTRCASGYIVPELLERPNLRVGILGPDYKVSSGVCLKGRSGIKTMIEAFDKTLIRKFDEVKNILTLVNGSIVFCYSSINPQSIEGEEFHLYWVDEVAELSGVGGDECIWKKRAEPGIRLVGDRGEPTRVIFTGTPAASPLIADLHGYCSEFPDEYRWTQLATRDNIANLDASKVERMYREAGDSLFAKMKLEGHLILESPNALLSEADLAHIRVEAGEARHLAVGRADLVRMYVDANHSDDKKSDECGIMVASRHGAHVRIHADASCALGPKGWGERIIEVLIAYPEISEIGVEDDKSLVIEVVENVLKESLRAVGRPIKIIKLQHKNRSKKVRADPVAVEYQLKHVLHDPSSRTPEWADLSSLEWQWKSWNPKDKKAKSPDRVDAAVYAVTDLLLRESGPTTFYRAGGSFR